MRDVILVKRGSRVKLGKTRKGHFKTRYEPTIGGLLTIPVDRGWASVEASLRGRKFRFVDTHLEAFNAAVRNLQAQELAALLAGSPLPVVLVGDLNSRPDDTAGAYGILTGALHLEDAWVRVHGPDGGFTSGQTDDLNLPESRLTHRIDYVLYQPAGIEAVAAEVIGEEQADRTPPLPGAPYGLWPSDHAGVAATLAPGRGSSPSR